MLEEFISIALEAFTNANGDVDKFELQLRRKLMVYNTGVTTVTPGIPDPTITNAIVTPHFEKIVNALDVNNPIFQELENIDVNNLSDQDILELAKKMGLMVNPNEIIDE
jgi:hypothetical protein